MTAKKFTKSLQRKKFTKSLQRKSKAIQDGNFLKVFRRLFSPGKLLVNFW
jgi:hypothetical protein